jgi:hypothetical protein
MDSITNQRSAPEALLHYKDNVTLHFCAIAKRFNIVRKRCRFYYLLL